jgi:hypothetical protein
LTAAEELEAEGLEAEEELEDVELDDPEEHAATLTTTAAPASAHLIMGRLIMAPFPFERISTPINFFTRWRERT